jgi:hypothetical protein
LKRKKQFHLLHQFNKKIYELIETFQKEKAINVRVHTKDASAQGDASYTP